MRISGWSSDVCSSDLCRTGAVGGRRRFAYPRHQSLWPGRSGGRPDHQGGGRQGRGRDRRQRAGGAIGLLSEGQEGSGPEGPERKSVVLGKSVSVRVDLGGGSSITKKTRKNSR